MKKLRLIKPWHLQTLRQKTFNDRMFIYEWTVDNRITETGPSQDDWSIPGQWSPFPNHHLGAPATRVIYKAPVYPR